MSNFSTMLHQYSKDDFLNNAKNVPDLRNDIVCSHYIYLLEFAKNNSKKTISDLIGLIHMCYGWMPTMYDNSDISLYNDNTLINYLWDNIKNGSLENDFLGKLITIANNSIIGGSKLLHFCNPEMYAIYDSRVYSSIIKKKTKYNVIMNDIEKYCSYIVKLKEIKEDKSFIFSLRKILKEKIHNINNYSDLRCLKFCFFYDRLNVNG